MHTAVKLIKGLPSKINAKAHDKVVLEVEVDASDIQSHWTKDGRKIDSRTGVSDSYKYELSTHDKTHTLKIDDVMTEQEAVYAFVVGKELTSSTLNVEGKKQFFT